MRFAILLSLLCLTAASLCGQPVFTASPSTIALTYQPGSPNPTPLQLSISSTPTGASFTAQVTGISTNWLAVTGSGVTQATLIVQILPAGLAPGFYSRTIVITPNGPGAPINIPVNLTVAGDVPGPTVQINVDPSSLTFVHHIGNAAPDYQTLVLTATGGRADYQIEVSPPSATWLSVSPPSGTLQPSTATQPNSQGIYVTVNPIGFEGGTYTASIKVIVAGGTSGNNTIPVTLNVGPATLRYSPNTFAFNYRVGDPAPGQQSLNLTSSSTALDYSVTSNAPWLAITNGTGHTPGAVSFGIKTAGLVAGTQSGAITISTPLASNPTVTLPVTLNVTALPTLNVAPAAISFTAPADGSTPAAQTLTITSSGAPAPFTIGVTGAPWLTATPTTGTTPATVSLRVNTATLPIGTQQGSVVIGSTGATGVPKSVPVFLTLTAPLPSIGAVTNAASLLTGPVAPGEIVTLFGSNLGPAKLVTAQSSVPGFLDKNLAGAQVFFDSVPAALIYTSANQVSAVVPYAVAGRASSQLTIESAGGTSQPLQLAVTDSAPALFSANASGRGAGAILNDDYQLNTTSRPAAPGSAVILYATGEGQTAPGGVDGKLASDPYPAPVLPVSVKIGGLDAQVLYAGAAPGLTAGLLQVNVLVPPDVTPGDAVPVLLTVGKATSPAGVTLSVR